MITETTNISLYPDVSNEDNDDIDPNKVYDYPYITIKDITTTSFVVDITFHTSADNPIYADVSEFGINVTNLTKGSSFKDKTVLGLTLDDFPYTVSAANGFVFYGGEKMFVTVQAVWKNSGDRVILTRTDINYCNTTYEPITKITTQKYNEDTQEWESTTGAILEVYGSSIYHDFSSTMQTKINPDGTVTQLGRNTEVYSAKENVIPSVADGTRTRVLYSIENTAIADVDEYGAIRVKKRGETMLTIAPADKINTETASVKRTIEVVQPVTSIAFDRSTLQLEKGKTAELAVTILPTDANNQDIEYGTQDSSIVSVAGNTITAVSSGTTTITAKALGKPTLMADDIETSVVVTVREGAVWNDIVECPKYLNASDFNSISDNANYVYALIGSPAVDGKSLVFPTVTQTTGFKDTATAIKTLVQSVAELVVQANEYAGTTITTYADISDDLTYALNRAQWNEIISVLTALKNALDNM